MPSSLELGAGFPTTVTNQSGPSEVLGRLVRQYCIPCSPPTADSPGCFTLQNLVVSFLQAGPDSPLVLLSSFHVLTPLRPQCL